jgi:hypothetical protein
MQMCLALLMVQYVHSSSQIIQFPSQSYNMHYHPFLVNSLTRPVTSLNPALNLALHRSLANLFLFNPPRSWNLCLLKSALTLFLAIKLPSIPIPLTISLPLEASRSTVRPYAGFSRGYEENVSSCWTASEEASEGLLDRFGFSIASCVGSSMEPKSRAWRRREGRPRVGLNSAPKTRVALPVVGLGDALRGTYGGRGRLVGMPPKRESIAWVVSSWVGWRLAASYSGT